MLLDELLDGYDRVSSKRLDSVVRRNRERLGILKISLSGTGTKNVTGIGPFLQQPPPNISPLLTACFSS